MKRRVFGTIALVLVLAMLITANVMILRARSPLTRTVNVNERGGFSAAIKPEKAVHPFLHVPGSSLTVYPQNYAVDVIVGEYVDFVVKEGDTVYTASDVTFEVVYGRDCGVAFISGFVLGLGEGDIVVKAHLDDDPGRYGYCALRVVPRGGREDLTGQHAAEGASAGDSDFESMISLFPESYKPYLRALHQDHPLWRFYAVDTGVTFFEAVYQETWLDKNKINNWNSSDIYKRKAPQDYAFSTGEYEAYDQYSGWNTGWVYGNELFVANYLDPRNYLDEQSVFQFESLRFSGDVHTVEGIEKILSGTFMYMSAVSYTDTTGNWVDVGKTHAQVLYEAGMLYGVSPYFLASKVRGEVAAGSLPSESVTGTYEGYTGYYNYFNVGAYDGLDEIASGLRTAAEYGWTSPEKAILGGTQFLAEAYIAAGQDTGYMQKFNVNSTNAAALYENQYMTDGTGAVKIGTSAFDGYEMSGLLDQPLEFFIPVFLDMPAETLPAQTLRLGGSENGSVVMATTLREGPSSSYARVDKGELKLGDVVKILRLVPTDAAKHSSQCLFFPYWYEVSVTRQGVTTIGFVSEEQVRKGSSVVLAAGETLQLYPTLEPAGNDDIVRYFSENPHIAQVTQQGLITAQGSGVVTIVGFTSTGALDCFTLTVTDVL